MIEVVHTPSIVDDAERMILGAAMLSISALDEVRDLDPADFASEKHGKTWKTILFCRERFKRSDALLVAHVARCRIEELGGYEYLTRLPECVASVECIRHYADIVKENAALRRVVALAGKLVDAEKLETKVVIETIGQLTVIAAGLAGGALLPCHPPERE